MAMISSITQLKNINGNYQILQACYANNIFSIFHFAECFVLTFERASFIRYFTLGFFL